MTKQEIEKLRNLPIESVAERLGLTVKTHKCLCCFHEDSHPSMRFNVSKNTFRCYACGAHGGVLDLAMQKLGKNFPDTCQWLADENNIIIEKFQPAVKQQKQYPPDVEYLRSLVARPVLNNEARQFLFDQRHFDPRVIQWLGISSISNSVPCWRYGKPFYDAPSLLFPYKDIDGNVMNVQSRYMGSEAGKPRFRFPPNGSVHIFNLPILRYLKPGEPLYISEGITDCMALLSSGHKAIAIPSATMLKPDDLKVLSPLISQLSTPLHIYPDNDNAGNYLYTRLLSVATSLGTYVIKHDLPEGCKDYSDYYIQQVLPVTSKPTSL